MVGYARRRGGFPVDYHATHLAIGAAAENLVQALAGLGGDPAACQAGVPGPDAAFFRLQVDSAMQALPAPADGIWLRRHTNRSPYETTPIAPESIAQLESCGIAAVGVQAMTGASIKQAADWVRQASEIRFQTREVNEWFAASLRYGQAADEFSEGLHVSTLALPPGGTALLRLMSSWKRLEVMNRLRAYTLFAAIEAANFQQAPLVLAVTADPAGTPFDAGRCLQRVWLKLTELGLSAHPYYVVSDLVQRLRIDRVPAQCRRQAETLAAGLQSALGADQTLHCLLRVGKPRRSLPVAGRFPVERLFCD